jgi:GNAT superfamily N-acetyltransferase
VLNVEPNVYELPDVDVRMRHPNLGQITVFPLPDGYQLRAYRAGDVGTWLRIHWAADRLFFPTSATFMASMPGDDAHLAERTMFLVDPRGTEVGTVTAWDGPPGAPQAEGQIHWVAIVTAAQGHGLSKPLVSAACAALRQRSYTSAFLKTNTRRIPAINVYLKLGFQPTPRDATELAAWHTIAPLLKTPIAALLTSP